LGNIASSGTPNNSDKYAAYTYLGAWTVIKVAHPAVTDGLNRRIAKLLPNGENWKRTDYYYLPTGPAAGQAGNAAWQCLEERYNGSVAGKTTVATAVKTQYVWDIRYIDAPVCRDEDKNSDGDCTDAATGVQGSNEGDEHLYYTNDANMNVTALVDVYDGAVVERYMYDAYGEVTVLHGVRDNDGTDTSGSEWSVRAAADDFDNEILYCGYRYDPETGLYHVRNRFYHPNLGRWMQRDSLGYIDGMSMYEYVLGNPLTFVDPSGLLTRAECEALVRKMVPLLVSMRELRKERAAINSELLRLKHRLRNMEFDLFLLQPQLKRAIKHWHCTLDILEDLFHKVREIDVGITALKTALKSVLSPIGPPTPGGVAAGILYNIGRLIDEKVEYQRRLESFDYRSAEAGKKVVSLTKQVNKLKSQIQSAKKGIQEGRLKARLEEIRDEERELHKQYFFLKFDYRVGGCYACLGKLAPNRAPK